MKFMRTINAGSLSHPALVALIGFAGLAACQMPLAFQDPLSARQNAAWQEQNRFRPEAATSQQAQPLSTQYEAYPNRAAVAETPLRSWNGVVQQPQGGSLTTAGSSGPHGLEPSVEGRMHIIELYQEVLDERDQLVVEVKALQDALASSQTMLEEVRGQTLTADTRIQALEEGNRILTEESRDMAARLTTSQIRRLESEKLLLETQISWHRERELNSAGAIPVAEPGGGE